MQNPSSEETLERPNGASRAYGAIIRHTESAREIEYRVFERVTSALESAASPATHFTRRIKATHDNRQLWQTLAFDLSGDENALPAVLRANLISLAIWVTRETDRVLAQGDSLRDLIEINYTIMKGLVPSTQAAN
jgi:flagellar protein FlaF